MKLGRLNHIGVATPDLDASIAFYRDVLGLPIVRDEPSDDDPDARHVWFDCGDGTFVTFMEYGRMPDGVVGIGSTHHFALRVETHDELQAWRDYLRERGVECTEVLDRGAFHSIYLRDPDGHIVEIATRGPGFPAGGPSA